MNHSLVALAFQESSDSSMWIILILVAVVLFFIVVIVVVGLTIFFIMRRRSKMRAASAAAYLSNSPAASVPSYSAAPVAAAPEVAAALDTPAPALEPPTPIEEIRSDVSEAAPAPDLAGAAVPDFDPSRTVAINRESTVAISYGTIKFVSGVLTGEQFRSILKVHILGANQACLRSWCRIRESRNAICGLECATAW